MINSIVFLFPRTGEVPIGGFKVIYEYGNRLSRKNIKVYYIYGIVSRKDLNFITNFFYKIFRFFRFLKYKFFINYTPNNWFNTEGEICHKLVFSLSEKYIPKCDVVVATSWATAFWVNDYKFLSNDRKFYFIQHFEDWHGTKEKVLKTWKMDLTKIVIAPWLKKIADHLGEESYLVENGFDNNEFFVEIPIEKRDKYSLTMLWHDNIFKGCSIGIDAFNMVKEKFPQLTVSLFGVPSRPMHLPSWISYYKIPDKKLHRMLYNKSAIFVGTSSSEGWGLTIGEAMLCGCAIACTNNEGYSILAKNEITALLSNIGNSKELSENIIRLINNDELRIKIAKAGLSYVSKYKWDKSFDVLYKILNNIYIYSKC